MPAAPDPAGSKPLVLPALPTTAAPTPSLEQLGYSDRWAAILATAAPDAVPARVLRDDRGMVLAADAGGARRLDIPLGLAPVTGDWLAVRDDAMVAVLDRATAIARPRPDGRPQVLAANVDLVGVVHALDQPLNRRRLERGLVLAWESGAIPVVLLTKADLCDDAESVAATARASAPGADVITLSISDGRGLSELAELLLPNRTLALIGASGAGKSSLANGLAGAQLLDTGHVRAGDAKGRHTTTHRELVVLPAGGVLLDTPGLRSLTLGAVEAGISMAFPEIDELAASCRFDDCSHHEEPDCAVLAAIADGDLSPDRYEGWRRIEREAASAALRADPIAYRQRSRQWGRMGREAMNIKQRGDARNGGRRRD